MVVRKYLTKITYEMEGLVCHGLKGQSTHGREGVEVGVWPGGHVASIVRAE